jgi:hypothetical protein
MKFSNRVNLMDDLRLQSGPLRGREIGRVRPLDRRRPRSRSRRRTLPMAEKRTSDDARLPPGGGRRRTHESVHAQLVQAFLGSLLMVLISLWARIAGEEFG